MKWGKIVLIFQAIITLLISLAFFSQTLSLDIAKISELRIEMNQNNAFLDNNAPRVMVDIKQRYTLAAYTLLIIGIFELLIIPRLIS
ncbi:hypothetical protein KAI32_00530 [Candidatus Pacearchaeota archaeon]|nr:hypothetical protein [Candidatus Pacearchaeota archaeon]